MKLTILILFVACLHVSAAGYSQQISLSEENASLRKVLHEIRKQSGYHLAYNSDLVKKAQLVTINIKKGSLEDALTLALKGQPFTFEIFEKVILITPKRLTNKATSPPSVQNIQVDIVVTGRITDSKGESLPGASVLVKGTSSGVTTDQDGRYSIVVTQSTDILVFSFVGMETREVSVAGRQAIDVILNMTEDALKEVVVVGYGSQSRQTVSTSISKLDPKVLENIPYSNAASALQGTLSGVRVQSTSGQPGAAPRIIVRGGTSINNPNGASPLYIVDGVNRSEMNNINASDIESIQVLKDAAATSIYGARGSNGVIIVTTKTGSPGKTSINYNYDLSTSEVAKTFDLLSARDFIYFQRQGMYATAVRKNPSQLANLSIASAGGTGNDLTNKTAYSTQFLTPQNQYKLGEGWESMPDPLDPTKTIIFQNVNFNDLTYRTGISHNHAISVSGGSEKATFNAGLGYLDTDGISILSFYKRLSVNLNGNLKVTDKLNVFGRLLYADTDFNNVGTAALGDPFGSSALLAPTQKYKFEDGALAPGGNFGGITAAQERKNTAGNLTVVAGANWKILPGLSFEPQISTYRINTDSRFFQRTYLDALGNPSAGTRGATGSHSDLIHQQADAVLTYAKAAGSHNFEVKGGVSYFSRENTSLSASGQGAASDLVSTLNASATPVSVGGAVSKQAIVGYFSRVNYDYKQKYLLTLNARYDGASNLGKNNKWGFFPGVSAGWNVHNEEFWKFLPEGLLQLKLRGSYGVNGNISNLGDYQAQGQYSVGNQYGGIAAVQNTVLANEELQWEQSKTLNGGFDMGLFDNRVRVLFDVFRRVTDNLLTNFTLPPSTGFASVLTNLGSLENKGIEIEIGADILSKTNPLAWNISFNASKVTNKILKLPFNGVENNRIGGVQIWDPESNGYVWKGGLQEGGTLGELFAYKQLGVYQTDADAAKGPLDNLVVGTDKSKFGGDVIWQDSDNNNIIDARDRVNVGTIYPKWTGGFSSSLSYQNLNLQVRMDYTTGHTSQNETLQRLLQQTGGQNALSSLLLQSWQKPGDVTNIPKFYWADQQAAANYSRLNSEFFERGDFLSLREVTLSYVLPAKLVQKAKINNVRLNVTGSNLHIFTNYRGLNPDEGGTDFGRYPLPRSVVFGVNVTL